MLDAVMLRDAHGITTHGAYASVGAFAYTPMHTEQGHLSSSSLLLRSERIFRDRDIWAVKIWIVLKDPAAFAELMSCKMRSECSRFGPLMISQSLTRRCL